MPERKKTVLLIDDSNYMRALIKNILIKHGFRIVGEAADGLAGVEKYKLLRPDLVTLDFNMDEATGLDALDLIMRHDPDAKVIMVSAMMGQRPIVDELREKGAKAFVTKPFAEKDVLRAIQSIL